MKRLKYLKLVKVLEKEAEMVRTRQNNTLLNGGILFIVIGLITFLAGRLYGQALFGSVLINLMPTGLFILLAGILATIIYYITK
jgi:hypothetical protein